MEELLQKLQNIHGLSLEQSHGVLNTITGYIKEKFPMAAGIIDNIMPSGSTSTSAATTSGEATTAASQDGDMLDKISDFIPGAAGQKIEDFAKSKLGGFFGGNKKV